MIRLQGVTEFIGALSRRATAVEVATVVAQREAVGLVQTATYANLTRTSHPPRTPTPSRPGEPPSTISGALAGSLYVEGPAIVGAGVFSRFGPTSPYGRIQELGGVAGRGARLPARPYLSPAVWESRGAIESIYRETWTAALTGR